MWSAYLIFSCIFGLLIAEECTSPNSYNEAEEYCEKMHVELIDRIQEKSQSLLNFARKKLGIAVEQETREPQKCEFYECILQQLQMMKVEQFPIYENIKKWIEENLTIKQGTNAMKQLEICNDALANCTINEEYFNGDVGKKPSDQEVAPTTSKEHKEQSKCEIGAEFFKCLSYGEECSVFRYP